VPLLTEKKQMNYSNKFCFIQKKEEAWIVSMYQREGNEAKLIKEIATSSEGEARKAQKEFFQ
jgi:hypothetical protein